MDLRALSLSRLTKLRSLPQIKDLSGKGSRSKLIVASGVIAAMGFAVYGGAGLDGPGQSGGFNSVAQTEIPGRDRSDQAATRSFDRQPVTEGARQGAPADQKPADQKPADQKPAEQKPAEQKPEPRQPRPVAGLDQQQMENATAIVEAGQELGVPRRGMVIAVATAMQESTLRNLASGVLAESTEVPHQGTGWDHDSVGLFQQRSSTGWGPVKDLMDPKFAAKQFYKVLVTVPGWEQMALTDAAQRVQVSAFPYHYAKHEGNAETVVNEILSAKNPAV
ncbi:peptidase M23 [Micromonospora sp. NPDC049679]|uniref:peptidase M23 n=1 Tax=Micromonospora sp. NPDC049679 TaxID=3155920 RepID=UPI0033FD32E7